MLEYVSIILQKTYICNDLNSILGLNVSMYFCSFSFVDNVYQMRSSASSSGRKIQALQQV